MKKLGIKQCIVSLILLFIIFPVGSHAAESTFDNVNAGIGQTGEAAGFPQASEEHTQEFFTPTLLRYIGGIMVLLGLIFMVIMIYGGFLWMTARGNEAQVEQAKKLLVAALIGFAITIGSRIIVEFILMSVPNPVRLN